MSETRTETDTAPESELARGLGLGPEPGGHPRRKRILILAGVAVLVAAGIALWTTGGEEPAVKYRTQEATRGGLDVTVTATGNLEPTNQVDVGSELSGIVKSVEVDYNDHVKVGQVLARLDPTKLQAQVLQSQAALQVAQAKVLQARATVTEAQSEMERLNHVRELSGGRLPSQHDMDAAQATLERAQADDASAEAQVAQARATLDGNQTDLKKLVIVSPIDGIVLTRKVEPGQTVAASLQAPVLFILAEDLAHMELVVDVDEADVGNVHAGQKATFSVDAYPDRVFPASVAQVRYGAATVGGVVTYATVLEVDNSDLSLRPGMTATADILVQQVRDALLVPNAALRFTPPAPAQAEEGKRSFLSRMFPRPPRRSANRNREAEKGKRTQHVYVLENGQPKAIEVVTGATDGNHTEITSGDVTPGMALAVDTVSTTR